MREKTLDPEIVCEACRAREDVRQLLEEVRELRNLVNLTEQLRELQEANRWGRRGGHASRMFSVAQELDQRLLARKIREDRHLERATDPQESEVTP